MASLLVLLCILYMHALFHFVGLDLYANELACAIAIGQAGMARLDDAEVLPDSLLR